MKDLSQRTRFQVVALLVATLVGAALIGPASAVAQTGPEAGPPSISLLNPSSGTSLKISDKRDGLYRISAWVSRVPAGARVDLELTGVDGTSQLGTAVPVGFADTFELQWDIPDNLDDGRYTLRAVLHGDTGAGVSRLAADEKTVTILHTTEEIGSGEVHVEAGVAAETVDFGYPSEDGRFEMDVQQSQGALGSAQVSFSEKTEFVRLSYSLSVPGTQPTWKLCGSHATDTTFNGFSCQLAQGDLPSSVTALAAVANTTPYNQEQRTDASQDESADAVRVIAYTEEPAPTEVGPVIRSIAIGAEATTIEAGETVRFFGKITAEAEQCGQEQVVKLKRRRPGGRFRTVASTASSVDGAFEFQTAVIRTSEFRAVAPATETCVRAISGTQRVRTQ